MSGIVGVILAGGRSSRMCGVDKCLMELEGMTLMDRVIDRLLPQVEALTIAAGQNRLAGYEDYEQLNDAVAGGSGPLGGLLAGLEWAASNTYEYVLSTPCDVPFLPRDLRARLREAVRTADAALACSGGQTHYVVGLWPVGLASALREQVVGHRRREAGLWAASLNAGIAVWPSDTFDPFHNVNRPEDLDAARRILTEFAP